jgi:electron transfer flavoprotein beta subunit
VAAALADAIGGIEGLDRSRLLLFGGCASASRDSGVTMQMVAERLDIVDQFLAVDQLTLGSDGSMEILERIEAGQYQVSRCNGAPAMLGWATGSLPEPPNNPQVGMMNMRSVMPALQRAQTAQVGVGGVQYAAVDLPKQRRETRIIKDTPAEKIAEEIVDWLKA